MELIILHKWILFVCYTILMIFYTRFFINQNIKTQKILPYALGLTIIIHLLYLIHLTLITHRLPLSNIYEVMTSYSFIFLLTYFAIECSIRDKSLGIIIIFIGWVLQFFSNILIDISKSPAEVLTEVTYFQIHVSFTLLAYSAFAISFISSLMYIMLSREIQEKRLGFFFSRLPSLELLDRLSNMAVIIGVVFITIGIFIGIYMATLVWGKKWPLDPKLISVFITWAIYVAFIYLRNVRNWQGTRASILSISGFIWILISFFVFTTLFSKVHAFI